ncbi:MAG: hypothetical protein HY823_06720 [Acidobacteria bacterium]|nr:hypothetical protein [Acidobacteriota bacterium]
MPGLFPSSLPAAALVAGAALPLGAQAWTPQDQRMWDDLKARGEAAVETTGTVASHEGTGKALDLLGEHFKNLSEGRGPDGTPLTRGQLRGMVDGGGKSAKVQALKDNCKALSDKLEKLGKAISIFDVGAKVAGHIAEGDTSGALIVIPQELGKQLCSKAGAFLGSLTGTPVGTVGGAALGEEAWKGLGGEAAFEKMAQQVKNLEKMAEYAGARIRHPAVLAYLRGEIGEKDLRKAVEEHRAQALAASIAKWRGIAAEYPGLAGDIEALIAGRATEDQVKRLKLFRKLQKQVAGNPALESALKAWTEGRSTPAQREALRGALKGRKPADPAGRKLHPPPEGVFDNNAAPKSAPKPAPSGRAALEARMNELRERHRELKRQLDASGGHDAATSREMREVYQEYLDVKKKLDATPR